MNKRTVVGVEIPADITDPRLSVEELTGHQAALTARFNELKVEGTPAIPKRAEITVVLEEIRQELQGRADLAAQDIAAAAALVVHEPVVADAQPVIVPPVNTTGHSDDVTVGAPVALDMAAEAEKEALVAAAREALQTGGGTLGGSGAELTPNDDAGKGPKTASWKPYMGAGTRIADTAPLDTLQWGERLGAAYDAVKNAAIGAPLSATGDGSKVYANRIASLTEDGSVDVTDALGTHQSAQGNTDLIVAALRKTRERHEAREGKAAAFCAPPDIVREIPFSSSDASPIRDALTFVPSAHMTWLFNAPMTTFSAESAVTSWNDANQAAVDPNTPSTWKSCINFDCIDAVSVGCQDWTVACATWPLAVQLSNPERVRDIQRRVEVVKTRRIEQKLRAAIKSLSATSGPWPTQYSSLPDFVYAVNTTMQYSGYTERLEKAPYIAIMDEDVIWNLWCDLSRTPHSEGRDYEAPIEWILKRTPLTGVVLAKDRSAGGYGVAARTDAAGTTNANPVVTDVSILPSDQGRPVTGTGIPANSFVGTVVAATSFRISSSATSQVDVNATATGTPNVTLAASTIGNPYADGRFIAGQTVAPFQIVTKYETQILPIDEVFAWGTGEIRMGAMQDFNLIRQNRVATFVEEAICLTKFGTHPWFNLQTVLCPTGTRTGWTTPIACV